MAALDVRALTFTAKTLRAASPRARHIVTHLRHPTQNLHDVYLVGTAHIGKRSPEEVESVIRMVKPSCVLVELCEARSRSIEQRNSRPSYTASPHESLFEKFVHRILDDLIRVYLRRAGVEEVAAPQLRRAVVAGLGLLRESGGDMNAAIQTARALNARLVLGDVPIDDTMRALSDATTSMPWNLEALMTSISPRFAEATQILRKSLVDSFLRSSDVDDAVESFLAGIDRDTINLLVSTMEEIAPSHVKAIVHDRDIHLARELRGAAASGTTVAVVGIAHVDGVERHFLANQQI